MENDRRKDYETRTRVHELHDRIERLTRKSMFAWAVLGLCNAIALTGFSIVLNNQAGSAEDIQQQRYDSVFQNCSANNYRNAAIREVLLRFDVPDDLIARFPIVDDCFEYTEERVQK